MGTLEGKKHETPYSPRSKVDRSGGRPRPAGPAKTSNGVRPPHPPRPFFQPNSPAANSSGVAYAPRPRQIRPENLLADEPTAISIPPPAKAIMTLSANSNRNSGHGTIVMVTHGNARREGLRPTGPDHHGADGQSSLHHFRERAFRKKPRDLAVSPFAKLAQIHLRNASHASAWPSVVRFARRHALPRRWPAKQLAAKTPLAKGGLFGHHYRHSQKPSAVWDGPQGAKPESDKAPPPRVLGDDAARKWKKTPKSHRGIPANPFFTEVGFNKPKPFATGRSPGNCLDSARKTSGSSTAMQGAILLPPPPRRPSCNRICEKGPLRQACFPYGRKLTPSATAEANHFPSAQTKPLGTRPQIIKTNSAAFSCPKELRLKIAASSNEPQPATGGYEPRASSCL